MIKTNAHFGIMAMHNDRKKLDPKPAEPEMKKWQCTPEEKAHYDTFKPPDRMDRYKTTARQRPVMRTKSINNIWGDDDK